MNVVSAFATAYGAIRNRMGAHRTRPCPQGLEIVKRGWPVLLITTAAAVDFANQIQEAEQNE